MSSLPRAASFFAVVLCALIAARSSGDGGDAKNPAGDVAEAAKFVPLTKNGAVLLDAKGKRLLLKTKVVLREGVLEMLVCRKQTKEHEAILAVDAPAFVIHTGLLALGVEPGSTVRFNPEYKPATGPKIDVFVNWTDEKGKPQRVAAQEWIRRQVRRYYTAKMDRLPADLKFPKDGKIEELRYDAKHKELTWYGPMTEAQRDRLRALSADAGYRKAIDGFFKDSQSRRMAAHWVFAGSGFFTDDEGKQHYQAEGGDLVCVANFPSAMLDIAEESSATGEENLLYEAWTEHVPPLETEVTVELIPAPKVPKPDAPKPGATKPDSQ